MACAAPICAAISTSSCSAGTAAATPQRPSTPCSASARASDPPTTATSSDNAADPGRPGASHRPPYDPPQSGPNTGPPACLIALETYFPKSKRSRTSPGTVQEPCLERRRPINIWCDRKQRDKPSTFYNLGISVTIKLLILYFLIDFLLFPSSFPQGVELVVEDKVFYQPKLRSRPYGRVLIPVDRVPNRNIRRLLEFLVDHFPRLTILRHLYWRSQPHR